MRSVAFAAAVIMLCAIFRVPKDRKLEGAPVQEWAIDLNSSVDVQKAGPIDANTHINVAYLGQNEIAVALLFPVRVNGKFSPVRDEETWRALLLTVQRSDGKILHSFRFDDFHGEGANSEWLQIGVVNTDELLAIFGNDFVRFSTDLVPLVSRTLPRETKTRNGLHYYDHWRFLTDPALDTALLAHTSPGGSTDKHWISTNELKDVEAAHLNNFHSPWSVLVGRQLVFSEVDLKTKESTVMAETEGQPARPLCDGAVFAAFGQNLLFVHKRPAASHVIVNLQGQEIYQHQIGSGSDTILDASGALTNNRVAFVYGALRSSVFNDWSGNDHVVVLDADLKREVQIPNLPDKGFHTGDQVQVFDTPAVALSPDGGALAIVRSPRVALWDVPSPAAQNPRSL